MPPFGPINRTDLIYYLRKAGFIGPNPGTKHAYMERGRVKVRIPNPDARHISKDLLKKILRDGFITRDEWEEL
jgi:hypothetical protein